MPELSVTLVRAAETDPSGRWREYAFRYYFTYAL